MTDLPLQEEPSTPEPRIVTISDLSINLDRRVVAVGGNPVHLTPKEFGVIELLALKMGEVVTKKMFLDHLYGDDPEPGIKIVDVFICKVRKKLDPDEGKYIKLVWGRGYVLYATQAPAAEPPSDPGQRPHFVRRLDGTVMTMNDLPPPGTKRWVIRRKGEVVLAVKGGMLTDAEARTRYGLSELELSSWQHLYNEYGIAGLRSTRTQ